jgi:hypothetical protein
MTAPRPMFAPTLFQARLPGAAPAQLRRRLDRPPATVQGAGHVESHPRHPGP